MTLIAQLCHDCLRLVRMQDGEHWVWALEPSPGTKCYRCDNEAKHFVELRKEHTHDPS